MFSQEQCRCNCHLSLSKKLPIRRLEVERLPKLTNPWELKEFFSQFGKVEECKMKLRNGKLKTLVTFYSAEDAKRVLEHGRNRRLIMHNRVLANVEAREQPRSAGNTENTRNDSGSKIDTLNNDCLIKIFLHLPIEDRIRLERVCKRWQIVSQASFACDSKLTLSVSIWKFLNSQDGFDREKLRKVLQRCGSHLKEINFPYIGTEKYSDAFTDIVQLSPNLQAIDVKMITLSSDSIRLFSRNCKNIRRLMLYVLDSPDDSALTELFKQSTKLTHFTISCNLGGECLLHLPRTIREIVLYQCDEFEFECLARALPNFRNLSVLELYDPIGYERSGFPIRVMEALSRHCKQLKELHVLDFELADPRCRILITDLTNLQILCLRFKVDDIFLLELSRNCKNLIFLDINSWGITLAGIEALVALPELKTLMITQFPYCESTAQTWRRYNHSELQKLPRITDFPSLKYFQCWGCYSLSPSEMCCILESVPLLELVGLYNYEEYYEHTIDWLIAQIVGRNNKVAFDVCYRDPN